MRKLLSIQQRRMLDIIEFLYSSDHFFIYELSDHFKCSPKTIRNDIHIINDFFYPVEIVTHQSKGISLQLPSNYSIEFVYEVILENSLEFTLLELIFFKKNLTVSKAADKLHSSPSTIRRLISKMNEALKDECISIHTFPIKMIGNEADICNFYVHLITEKYSSRKKPFSSLQLKALDQALLILAEKEKVSLNFPDIEKLRIWIMVNIVRMQNDPTGNIVFSSLNEEKATEIVNSLTPTHKITFKMIFRLELDVQVISRLFYVFLVKQFAFDATTFDVILNGDSNAAKIVSMFDEIITNTAIEFDIPLLNKKEILLNLYNVSILQYGQPFILYDKCRFFIESIEMKNPEFTDFLKRQYMDVFNQPKLMHYELYSYLYFTITHWQNLPSFLDRASPKLRVVLFFNTDIEHMEFIKNEIALRFQEKLVVQLVNDISLSTFKKNVPLYDIILTNISGIQNDLNNVLCFSINPKTNDWTNLYKLYLKIAFPAK